MKRRLRKLTSALLAVIISVSVLVISPITTSALTQNDVVSWMNSKNGTTIYDGGSQCVAAFNSYLRTWGISNPISKYPVNYAYQIFNYNAPDGWQKISGSGNYQVGDVVIWNSSVGGGCGHVGMVYSTSGGTVKIFDQNYVAKNVCGIHNIAQTSAIRGVFRPPLSNPNPPTNVYLDKNQYWYDIQDTITLYPHADGATYYWLSVYKGDNHIVDTCIYGEYSFSASTWGYGDYYAWITAANSAGGTDSAGINFSVVGEPTYTKIYTSNSWYDLADTVSITVDTVCSKGQVIGIDKEGVGRVVTESTDSTFNIDASKLGVGKYSAYFTVFNGSGGIDTKSVKFEIVDKPKKGAIVTTSKKCYRLDDEVEISVSVECSKGQCLGLNKDGVGRIITDNADNGKYVISANVLGVGSYSAYFSVYNNSGGYDTEKIYFTIIDSVIGDVNSDGEVTIDDVTLLQKYLAENSELSETQISLADVNGDGDVMIDDVTMIQKYLAGAITKLG